MKRSLYICIITLISFTFHIFAEDEQSELKEPKHFAQIKKSFKLPYDIEFPSDVDNTDIQRLKSFLERSGGIANFALVSEITDLDSHTEISDFQHSYTSGLSLSFVSGDLTQFNVTITKPISCRNVCDMLFNNIVLTSSGHSGFAEDVKPNLGEQTYSLLYRGAGGPSMWYICMNRGTLISAGSRRSQQPLRSPLNQQVLEAQLDLLVRELNDALSAERPILGGKQEYYSRLSEEFRVANKHIKNSEINLPSEQEVKLDLAILSTPPKPETLDENYLTKAKRLKQVIKGEPYIVLQANKKAIPVVKTANPQKVNTSNTIAIFDNTHRVFDVHIDALSLNDKRKHYVMPELRSDGRYQVRFYGAGKQLLRVFYLNRDGKVVQFGETEVEVVDNGARQIMTPPESGVEVEPNEKPVQTPASVETDHSLPENDAPGRAEDEHRWLLWAVVIALIAIALGAFVIKLRAKRS